MLGKNYLFFEDIGEQLVILWKNIHPWNLNCSEKSEKWEALFCEAHIRTFSSISAGSSQAIVLPPVLSIFLMPLFLIWAGLHSLSKLGWQKSQKANLDLASKLIFFMLLTLSKPQITDLAKPQRIKPQPQKGWPHPLLKFWGFLRITLKQQFSRILKKPRILSYF